MKCPFCNSDDCQVVDTRKYDTCILRIRKCLNPKCGLAWHTQEVIEITKIEKIAEIYIKINS